MKANKNIVANADNSKAIFIEKSPYGYRLKETSKNLAGEWCCSFGKIESRIFKTLKEAKERAIAILG